MRELFSRLTLPLPFDSMVTRCFSPEVPGWSEPPDEICSKETFTVTPQAGMGKV